MNIRIRALQRRYVVAAVTVTAVVAVPMASPLPATALSPASQATPATLLVPADQQVAGTPKVTWPSMGRARVEVAGLGTVGEKNSSTESVPIASITKVMVAYTILDEHPLKAGAKGPKIRITKADVSSYKRLKTEGAAVVKVKAGKKLTERQALQGLLIPSGANLAETLARWDAGSVEGFVAKMNESAQDLGLDSTAFADPTGLDEGSRSSTEDLLDLAQAAMRKPAFAEIVKTKSVKIPYNALKSTNQLLGRNGVIGIKTGTTYAAGGCLLFAATDKVGGRTYKIFGVMLGARGTAYSANALKFSRRMVVSTRSELRPVTLVKRGKAVVSVRKPNGDVLRYGVKKTVTSPGWSGLAYSLSLPRGLAPGETPKRLVVKAGSRTTRVPLIRVG